jgi:hypothetical protein
MSIHHTGLTASQNRERAVFKCQEFESTRAICHGKNTTERRKCVEFLWRNLKPSPVLRYFIPSCSAVYLLQQHILVTPRGGGGVPQFVKGTWPYLQSWYTFVDQIKSDHKWIRWIHFRISAVINTLLLSCLFSKPTTLLTRQPGIGDRSQTVLRNFSAFQRVRTGFVAHTVL